ncbi:MAG: hypothetical protein RJQ14_14285, partial [Marinoscillum sp.]
PPPPSMFRQFSSLALRYGSILPLLFLEGDNPDHRRFRERVELDYLEWRLANGGEVSDGEIQRYFDLKQRVRGIYIDRNGVVKFAKDKLKYLRQKGVNLAWKQEKELVEKTGLGTRNWTAEEIDELIENGKVEGYEGHHINNVANHPEMADDPDNIEFVTADEHIEDRHGGNTHNPTSGEKLNRSERLKEANDG